jgi:hypothetical protein
MNTALTAETILGAFDAAMAEARTSFESSVRRHLGGMTETEGMTTGAGDWSFVEEREGRTYTWPKSVDEYARYWVYRAPDGRLCALGLVSPESSPPFWVTFLLGSGGGSPTAIVVFNAADDYAVTGEALAIIRGKGGGKAMFGPEDALPPAYHDMRIETYRDRISGRRGYSFNKAAVIAHRDDHITMLRHALAQVDLRGIHLQGT